MRGLVISGGSSPLRTYVNDGVLCRHLAPAVSRWREFHEQGRRRSPPGATGLSGTHRCSVAGEEAMGPFRERAQALSPDIL